MALTLREVEAAIRAGWTVESCDPVDVPDWSADNPSRGQCGATALVVHDLFGGVLVTAEVLRPDGSRQGFHHWNRLAGVDIDLTAEQFAPDEAIQLPHVIERPPDGEGRLADQYAVLRDRVQLSLPFAGGVGLG